jgi:hypothetical protein
MSIICKIDNTRILELSDDNLSVYNRLLQHFNDIELIYNVMDNNILNLSTMIDNNLIWDIWIMKELDRYFLVDKLLILMKTKEPVSINKIQEYEIELSKRIVKVLQSENYRSVLKDDYCSCCMLFWVIKFMYIYFHYVVKSMDEFNLYLYHYSVYLDKIITKNGLTLSKINTLYQLRSLATSCYC